MSRIFCIIAGVAIGIIIYYVRKHNAAKAVKNGRKKEF